MTVKFIPWQPDADVCGFAAGLAAGNRVLDLVHIKASNGTFLWEVIDGCEVVAFDIAWSAADARRAAENAGRRALFSIAA